MWFLFIAFKFIKSFFISAFFYNVAGLFIAHNYFAYGIKYIEQYKAFII